MKHKLLLLAMIINFGLCVNGLNAQTTKTVGGAGANYATLKLAFDAINAGTINGVVILQITGSTTETASAILNSSGTGSSNFSSLSIYPTGSNYTIGGNVASALINLNGADNVTIDGRVNASGSSKDLVITNSNTGASATTIKFVNSAENNTVKYCTVKGSESNTGLGVILFTSSSAGNGNDNNLIDNNNITSDAAGRPCNGIYSTGSTGRENSVNTISNNNIYDIFNPNNNSNGITVGSNSNDWVISGNSIYETTTIVSTGGYNYTGIYVGSSKNHSVNGNYIGGSASQCGGTAMTIGSSYANYFCGITIASSDAVIPLTVQNNVIKNINYTSTNSNPWDGMYISAGTVNANITGNTIGATTGTGSIVLTCPNASATATLSGGTTGYITAINLVGGGSGFASAPTVSFSASGASTPAVATASISGGAVNGFSISNPGVAYTSVPSVSINSATYSTSHGIRQLSTGAVTISNNNFGSITTFGTTTYSHCFESIVISGTASTITINNNLIGSLTTASSIQTSSAAAS